MSGAGNLTPFNTLTPERRREISSMGGKARQEQRRELRREIERIKAEERAQQELAHESLYLLCEAVRELHREAIAEGFIKPRPRRRRRR